MGVLIYFAITALFHPFIISGKSMEPTFHPNDILLCQQAKTIRSGDVYIIQDTKHSWKKNIKRLYGLPGDTLEIRHGTLYVNNKRTKVTDIAADKYGVLEKKITLSPNEYFFLGDNINNSRDSREYGPIGRTDILLQINKKLGERK